MITKKDLRNLAITAVLLAIACAVLVMSGCNPTPAPTPDPAPPAAFERTKWTPTVAVAAACATLEIEAEPPPVTPELEPDDDAGVAPSPQALGACLAGGKGCSPCPLQLPQPTAFPPLLDAGEQAAVEPETNQTERLGCAGGACYSGRWYFGKRLGRRR